MFGKSAAVVDARRDIKRRVVEIMVQCAEIGPRAVTGNGTLTPSEAGEVQRLVIHEFILRLSEADKITLRTAKGCTSPPAELENKDKRTLWDHIQTMQQNVTEVGCMAGFVHDGVLWAKQVAQQNPHSNINWFQYQQRIDAAVRAVKLSLPQYAANPGQREPENVEESFYWLIFRAGAIHLEEPQLAQYVPDDFFTKPKILPLAPQVTNFLKPRLEQDFNRLSKDFQINANLQELKKPEKSVPLFKTYYFEGKLPPEARF
jgi:hypothetical protein